MKFIAIDFETANPDLVSICQLGAVSFQDDRFADIWPALLNPEDYFDPMNALIHGINDKMFQDAPTFPQVFDSLEHLIARQIFIYHTNFDSVALNRVIEKYR